MQPSHDNSERAVTDRAIRVLVPEKAMALQHSPQWPALSCNHLEGRKAAFFSYGDGGADETDHTGGPKILQHKAWFDPGEWPAEQDRDASLPLVLQCRWSGIEVPEALRWFAQLGAAQPHADNQAPQMMTNAEFISTFDAWTDRFAAFVQEKGTVTPGRYRAFGYRPPGHRWADVKLAWRDLRMRLGYPRRGSSPALQQAQGLNQDATQSPKRSEAKCHRL